MHSNDTPDWQPKILLVDDDPTLIQALRKALAGLGTLYFATNGHDALTQIRKLRPDLTLLDAEMPGLGGLQVCEALRSDPELVDMPVIFVTRHNEQEMEQAALEVGAVDFITKPLRPAIVAMRVKTHLRLKRATDQLRRLAHVDGLTGLDNRRSLETVLEREWQRGLRAGQPMSVLMIDVDHFKDYNDRYGHAQGDDCLCEVGRVLQGCVQRPADLVARYGGEEFAVVLPDTDAPGALRVGQHILSRLHQAALPHQHPKQPAHSAGRVSVSVGAGTYDNTCSVWTAPGAQSRSAKAATAGPADLLRAADLALYAAKRAGRAQQCHRPIDVAIELRLGEAVAE
jgi:diguanylate cyclase (GGDEF)-like protein